MLFDDPPRALVSILHQLLHLLIDAYGGRFAVVAMLSDLAAQEDLLLALAEAQGTELAHAPLADHLAGHIGGALYVVARAGGDVVHENLLGDTAAHQNGELRLEIFLVIAVLVVDGE